MTRILLAFPLALAMLQGGASAICAQPAGVPQQDLAQNQRSRDELGFEVAVEPQVPKTVVLRPNITKIVVVSQDIRTVNVGNPEIADVITLSARKVSILPKKDGTTSIDILGDHGDEIARIIADVDTYTGTGASRVEINNKAKLTSSTIFRCAPLCRYVDELTVKEPASLPRGHFQAGYDYNIPNIPNAPPPAPPGALVEPGG